MAANSIAVRSFFVTGDSTLKKGTGRKGKEEIIMRPFEVDE